MVAWSPLAVPILLSAGLIFIASSIIHMVLQLHKPDYRKLSNEEDVRAAIRAGAPTPGQYILPYCDSPKDAGSPEVARKFEEGPVGVLLLRAAGPMKMGPFLGRWVLYTVAVSALAAYLARSFLTPSAPYLTVFRLVGTAAWLAYSWQAPADSIWKGKPWSVTAREMFDGLVYASLTAGSFAWLWPR